MSILLELVTVFSSIIIALTILIIGLEYYVSREKMLSIILKFIIYILSSFLVFILFLYEVIDGISVLFSATAIVASLPISVYAISYGVKKKYGDRFHVFIDLFALSMIYTFASPNLLSLAIAWTTAELLGFTMISIGEQHAAEEKGVSASKRFLAISTTTFELTLFTMIYVSIFSLAGLSMGKGIDVLIEKFSVLEGSAVYIPLYIAPLLLIGFIAKSAQIPLHFWLPDAHTIAPAPASSLLSGIMTGMGIYGLLRVFQIIEMDIYVKNMLALAIMFLGIASIVYGGFQAYIQKDIKRMLAYSTIAGNGFTLALLSLYVVDPDPVTYTALLASFVSHAIYKASLFLNAGSIEVIFGTRNIDLIRGAGSFLPSLLVSSIMALFSLIGMPPTIGFVAKLLAILASLSKGFTVYTISVIIAVVLSIIVSVLIGFRYITMYYGEPSALVVEKLGGKDFSDSYRSLLYTELVLASFNICSLLILVFTPIEKGLINAMLLASIIPVIVLIYIAVMMAMRGGVRSLR